jgi:serine/threonine protein kinase
MFKVCSLLGIGPRVVSSSYDLICFNNCIEFRMELCEPITSSQFYANHQEVSLLQMRSELMSRLAKLHSLNIVHRDIKPENILYSNSRKTFLFGDFGMNVLLS